MSRIKRAVSEHRHTAPKFVVVGGISTVLNYSVFFLLYQLLDINYILSSATGYIAGVFLGFGLNRRYTFQSRSNRYTIEVIKYLSVYTFSLFFGIGVLETLVRFGVPVLLGNVLTIGCTTVTNYIGSKYFVFSRSHLIKRIEYWLYRYRYLATYIIIGVSSLFIEMLVVFPMKAYVSSVGLLLVTGFLAGMLFSFVLNSRINFKVPPEKNMRTLQMFTIISTFAFSLNILLIRYVFNQELLSNYSVSRFLSAGCIFLMSYSLHRRFTFTDVKNVGIAVYVSESEDVKKIKEKVSYYPDWIHLDLVDTTFNPSAAKVDLSKGLEARKYWPRLKTMTHIMSRNPVDWIGKVAPFSDYILIHTETDTDIQEGLAKIRECGKRTGIVLSPNTDIGNVEEFFDRVDIIMILGIRKPGESGQHMDASAIQKLNELNELKKIKGYRFEICFDGGIKLSNVEKINAQYIVSGSAVLNSPEVKESIYALKTSSKYYFGHRNDLKEFLRKKIFGILEGNDHVISGTLVGSFVDKKGIEGISDIDIIVIVDKLTKDKFDSIVQEFQALEPALKTDYDHDMIINTTFGPLKYNREKTVVFHLMIYDVKGHVDHCLKSPFTCMEWQRSDRYVKKKLTDIWDVKALQPNYFFSSRRSVSDYTKDLLDDRISYREYSFKANGEIEEVKKYKAMENKDRFEFSYHIIRFCMLNFLKLWHGSNRNYNNDELVEGFFGIFPKKSKTYAKYLRGLEEMKNLNRYPEWSKKNSDILQSFLEDFEEQFNVHFNKDSTKAYFIRHQKTEMNVPGTFIGQRSDPGILREPHDLDSIKKVFANTTISSVYSSSRKRCMETLELLDGTIGTDKIIIDRDLEEIDYGTVDGRDLQYLKTEHPVIIEAWSNGDDPRFPGGENTADVRERMKRFLESLQVNHKKGSNIIACTHNVFLRCLVGELEGIPAHKWHLIRIPHLEPIEVVYAGNEKPYLNISPDQREYLLENIISEANRIA